MNQSNQLREISTKLIKLEKENYNTNNFSEILHEYLYNTLNLNDVFLSTLLLDREPFNRQGCIGYINYLKGYLLNKNDSHLTDKVLNFVKYIYSNKYHKSLKAIAKTL